MQDPDAPVEERISKVMRESGAAITVTSMTNIIAFAVGAYTNLDALFAFSLYAAIGLLFIYIYTVTLFTAFLALDARREMRARARGGNVHAFSVSPDSRACLVHHACIQSVLGLDHTQVSNVRCS